MKYPYSQNRLILFPSQSDYAVDQQQLVTFLREQHLLGSEIEPQYYEIGEQFLSLICFLGCSPFIELAPQHKQTFCYVQLPETEEQPRFIAGKNVKVPRCLSCKAVFSELPAQLNSLLGDVDDKCDVLAERTCPACGETFYPAKRNWRKSAVFARTVIVIGNIYESEAVPDATLMDALQASTGVAWQYAYIRGE